MQTVHSESYKTLNDRVITYVITRHCIGSKAEYYALKVDVDGVTIGVHTGKTPSYVYGCMDKFVRMYAKVA